MPPQLPKRDRIQPTTVRLEAGGSEALRRLQQEHGVEAQGRAIEVALVGWCRALDLATADLEGQFGHQEWNYLADAFNGTLLLIEGVSAGVGQYLALQVWDCHRLDGYGAKWLAEEGDDALAVEGKVRSLVDRLAALDFIHGWAVLAAVGFFWSATRPDRGWIDHTTDPWWTLAYRRAHAARARASEGGDGA